MDEALDAADERELLDALQLPALALRGLHRDNGPWYLEQLLDYRQEKALVPTHPVIDYSHLSGTRQVLITLSQP